MKGILGANNPLIAVASCESGFRQWENDGTPLQGKITPTDTGVLQINRDYHLEHATELGIDLDTLEGNVAYGTLLYQEQGLKPWSSSAYCWKNKIK